MTIVKRIKRSVHKNYVARNFPNFIISENHCSTGYLLVYTLSNVEESMPIEVHARSATRGSTTDQAILRTLSQQTYGGFPVVAATGFEPVTFRL